MNFSPNGRSPDLRLLVVRTFPDFHPVAHAEHPSAYSCGGSHGVAMDAHHVPFLNPWLSRLRYQLVSAAIEQFARHSSKKIPCEQKS